jgi:hypothetical protein
LRQTLNILVLFCYLLFNAGMAYSLHYCGSELVSAALYANEEAKCVCGGSKADSSKSCCNDVSVESADSEQKVPACASFSFSKTLLYQFPYIIEVVQKFFSQFRSINFPEELPPPKLKVPTYILIQVFRI